MGTSNQNARPAGDMMFSLEVKRSSRPQETSKVMKPRILSPQANQSPKFQEKHNIAIPIGQCYLDQNHETRRRAGDVLILLPKSSKHSQNPLIGSKANKNDELVKNMSNLPGYLQRVEKGENRQEKALNFGVLDWERLETWKHKKVTQPRGDASASSSGSSSMFKVGGSISQSGFINSKSLAPHKKQVSPSLREGISHDIKQSHVREDFKASSQYTLEGQRKPPRRNQSSGRNQLERCKREGSDRKIRSKKGTTLSDLRKHEYSRPSKNEKRAQYRVVNNGVEDLQALKYYFGQKHCPGEHRSSVLLLSKHSPRESCFESVQSSEPGILSDAKPGEANQEGFSDGFSSEEVHSGEMYSGIPHSCPLPIGVRRSIGETPAILSNGQYMDENASRVKPSGANGSDGSKRLDRETTEPAAVKGSHSSPNHRYSFSLARISRSLSFKDSSNIPQLSSTFANIKSVSVDTCPIYVGVETKGESDLRRHRLSSAQSMELSCDDSHMVSCPIETLDTPSYSNAIRGYKQVDQEATEAVRGRHPSPDPGLDFGIGRMSRSFSFKEASTVPQLSSTYATVKSGPVGSEVSNSLDNANKHKTNFHGRSRSSPLRRLLDPLLKGRPTNSRHSAYINHPLAGNDTTSTIQAFLQLTIKHGLPLFKLVANNNNDILVAVKNATASRKDDSSWIFTFYSVCEIKKKSGSWISQGHKGKNHGFGYNVIGQMKFSGSYYPDLTVQNPNDQFTVKESVLYSVDDRQGDHESVQLAVNREVAAIIVRIPMGNSDTNGDEGKKGKELIGKGFGNTTVILPGGVHGLPNNGAPSPLIERWKSGGSCDCGGWDVGCKLRILTDEDRSCNLMEPSISCSSPDQFDLFNQGGGGSDNRPIFSLEPFEKGIYSVQFSPSISLLQAFSVCVAVISNQKSFDFSEANHPSEAELLHESNATGCDRMKTPTKYVPPPPLSPVGRA
ncbi:hypothetical protein RHMOL_Rhmol05G0281500 [Rhododendron molle]|uniref:Uncharacterized protein n=3 Tax=Rhododendron molle TaxID=49168 RepID=A0ACC0NV82_RHOML|nr:hypothetical protein RHMOL_Rhmol05G0281500 [Rhododendron molle]KAI8556773.1 hypothetical protein RHMOL_Rhmol05G0281500 [Rhododendron molle]KAI8556774.1 hypothetical protein RHMOL_Rhmol05G0281500 [Rhododendron molle]